RFMGGAAISTNRTAPSWRTVSVSKSTGRAPSVRWDCARAHRCRPWRWRYGHPRCPYPQSVQLAQGPERRLDLGHEELRLLPGREVAAFVELVVVDEVGIRPLRPAPRRRVELVGKDAH